MQTILAWCMGPVFLLVTLVALSSALSGATRSWDGHPWAFVFGSSAMGGLYLWSALRPSPWPWAILILGWIAVLIYLGLPPDDPEIPAKQRLVPFQGFLFVLLQGYFIAQQIHFRDLLNPRKALQQLKSLKERMWLRSLEPSAPILGLVSAQPRGTWFASAHLMKVEDGWLLLWGEAICSLFADEVDLVQDEERTQLRITLKDRMLLFLWPAEGHP
jgi:hypothetical protein